MKIVDLIGKGVLSHQLEYDLCCIIQDLKALKTYVDNNNKEIARIRLGMLFNCVGLEYEIDQSWINEKVV